MSPLIIFVNVADDRTAPPVEVNFARRGRYYEQAVSSVTSRRGATLSLRIGDEDLIPDTEIKVKGFQILAQHHGDVDAERFIALIQREPFDYTKWRQVNESGESVQVISCNAMAMRKNDPGADS